MSQLLSRVVLGLALAGFVAGVSAESRLPDLTTQAPYKKAYAGMLAYPDWVSTGQGTAAPVEKVVVDGKTYTVGQMCKPHDCADNQLNVVFSPDAKHAWGLLSVRAENAEAFDQQYLGMPDETIKKLLKKSFADNNPTD
ncbi:Ivy family c-type lysozyme inhibitor [Pseudomonas weihenstephanensis]|uniref:Lysozyme inhibitor n=1 Tax=Pseudomonas weihenstephanensis TaxID=1608994 RepID=A0A0J6IZY9_9PSED|nr:Ivy family c-type lysozyme inhibitor [Pseudomonas weihenstephanensis]KMN13317.1 lysozyme inhibitor [Pseudomonas weihenstephanensis]KMN17763.1 lysozyme inhibitor [Pseudomonas weihenstephanensis]MBM1191785.1 lysozyme inhibitor [Pseudomonas weihenstephanensis]GLX91058.1 hypothetical protein Pfra02_36260 [Pseudomonas fragi]